MSRVEPNRITDGGSATSALAALIRDYREFAWQRLWLALALMLLGALAEGFGLLMIVPLAAIAIGDASGAAGRILPWLSAIPADQRFAAALALFLIAMAARSLLLWARDVEAARLLSGYEAALKLRCAATLAGRGWSFAARVGQAGMQSLLLTDVPRVTQAVNSLQQIVITSAMLLVQLTLTALIAPKLTAVAVVILAAGALAMRRSVRRSAHSGMVIVDRLEASAGSGFRLHAGLKAALAQGTTAAFLDEYETSLGVVRGHGLQFVRDLSRSRQLSALGAAGAAALLLFLGVQVLAVPFPVLIASLALFARMAGPAQGLQNGLQEAAGYAPAFGAVRRKLGGLEAQAPPARSETLLDWQSLSLERVRYEHQPGLGLTCASLTVARGEWVGIGGASGAGKTTLLDLVAGLLAPQQGAILADGQSLHGETLDRWRQGIAYAGQDGALFNDSVKGNLLCEGARAGDQQLWQALDMVGLAERVRAFPAGLEENVGDRGSQLSGGERQRLVIARALLRRPSMLILDEATAALDAAAETALLQRVKTLEPRPAALIVAHRESTLASCDRRITIQHDGVAEPDEVPDKDG